MKPLARRDAESLATFLRQKRFRNMMCNRVYACIVRGFLQFLREHGGPPTIPLVKAWLDDRSLHWPLHLVCNNAGIVDRFLRWMDRDRTVPRNPFDQLRRLYGGRLIPIVRALVSNDDRELQRLKPLAPYASFLGLLMREHVERMRSLGYLYQTNERVLLRFDRFLQGRPDLRGEPLRTALEAWRAAKSGPQHLKTVSSVGRQLSKAMQRLNPDVVVPPYDLDADRRARQLQRKPFIYTETQIVRLLETTKSFETTSSPLRAASLHMMILLIYCAGLRIGEVARLTLADVNVKENIIQIRNTKFFKSRILPIAPSVGLALREYLEVRRELGGSSELVSGLFSSDPRGGSYSCGTIRNLLTEALRRAGLKPLRGRVGPRIHDLRHAMVCNRMEAWYREGINPQSRLPYLATYLGHKDINSTLAYLTITEQLMQHANERFRSSNVGVLGSGSGGGRS
jgi:integrase/recombinase XerD